MLKIYLIIEYLYLRVHFWETAAIAGRFCSSSQPFWWPVGGTKIVLCLLPRLQHWQHDVAIYSQYCISMAFCEKVAANLSPQSAGCQCEEGSSRATGWGELGQLCPSTLRPAPLISAPLPRCHPRASLQATCSPLPADKSYCPHQCLMGENQSYFSRVSLSLFAGMWRLEEERVNGNWMVVTIKL